MDPQLAKLDPKVAETFNRVMNTPVPPPSVKPLVQTPPSGMPTVAAPASPDAPVSPSLGGSQGGPPPSAAPPPPIVPPAPVQPQPEMPAEQTPSANPTETNPVGETTQPEPQSEPPKVVVVSSQETQVNSANSQVFSSKKKAGKVSPVIVVLGMTVFFLVYTLIWVKVFNIKLPFLP